MISPRDWNKGDSNRSRAHLQEPVDAIRELQRAAFGQVGGRADGAPEPVEIGIAKIVNSGPNGATDDPDFTDARYWIQRILILFGDADDPVQVDVDTTDQISYQSPPNIFVATNWPERQAGTHGLVTDGTTEVMYFAFWDAGSPQQKHYVFYHDLPQIFRFKVTAINQGVALNQSYLLAQQYGGDGVTLSGIDTPILRRGAHFVGQDILAIRLPNGVTAYANDPTLYPQTSGPPTSPYNVTIQWEEVRGWQLVLCYHFVPFAGEGSAYTSHGGWYDAYMRPDQQVLPTTTDAGQASDDNGANDQPCVFFNWIEQGMAAGGKFHDESGHHALGVIMGYTATTPPKPIVYAVGGLPGNNGLQNAGVSAWSTGANNAGSTVDVLTDISINFTTQVATKHFQTLAWNGYGWIKSKSAQT